MFDREAPRVHQWQIVAVSVDNWVAHHLSYLDHLPTGVRAYDDIVRMRRGGMRQEVSTVQVHVFLVTNPSAYDKYVMSRQDSIFQLIRRVASDHEVLDIAEGAVTELTKGPPCMDGP